MHTASVTPRLSYQARIEALRARKAEQTREKWQVVGSMNHDDHALVLPPLTNRKIVQAISGSGMPITDVLLDGVGRSEPISPMSLCSAPSWPGENFKALLGCPSPVCGPHETLVGRGLHGQFQFLPQRALAARFRLLSPQARNRKSISWSPVYGAAQHTFARISPLASNKGGTHPDQEFATIGRVNGPQSAEFYDGLEAIVLGIQDWIDATLRPLAKWPDRTGSTSCGRTLENDRAIKREARSQDPPTTFTRGVPVDALVSDGCSHV